MPRAFFLSPHLDDVAFSCGATLFHLLQNGWDCELVTVFTVSVMNPTGFALACQTDKGLAPEVDYMALRRAEDEEFCRIIGVKNWSHWEFEEAPHRGYDSAAELFAEQKPEDEIWREIAEKMGDLSAFDAVFAPQGLGNHVDHRQVIRAVNAAEFAPMTRWYRDTPYAIREPDAQISGLLPRDLAVQVHSFDEAQLQLKIRGCCAYASQIGFQFGGGAEVERKLRAFHLAEAQSDGSIEFAERFLAAAGR